MASRDCCLGHLGRLRGIPDNKMAWDVSSATTLLARYSNTLGDSFSFLNAAMAINDSIMLEQEKRERRLISLFLANGIELKFVD